MGTCVIVRNYRREIMFSLCAAKNFDGIAELAKACALWRVVSCTYIKHLLKGMPKKLSMILIRKRLQVHGRGKMWKKSSSFYSTDLIGKSSSITDKVIVCHMN
ncbi:hypothetical protein CIPAW_16G026100 [Carya illinoinensis]|uniref:Uncharacterized protein n=1 Tax=Carya illinoinensis TaxID=32201 RepID=A0A8T1N3J3_CARIL|nr:hypothetical protein CIPAW_16G026100 [Carya illinoinensis]